MPPDQRPAWQSVKIFVSSTFEDMHAERDLINRRVIPRLREWCAPRRLMPIGVDYRWGITDQDAKENKLVIQKCLDAINDSQIFLYLVGQRRGWVPRAAEINNNTFAAYPNLRSAVGRYSMTEMEVLHAAQNYFGSAGWGKSQPCLFYRRSESFAAEITAEDYARFLDQGEDGLSSAACQHDLRTWRDETLPALLSGTAGELHDYTAACARTQNGVFLTDFSVQETALSDQLFATLTRYLVDLYPQHTPLAEDASPLEKENERQAYYSFFNTLDKVERADGFSRLDDYVEGDQTGVCVLHAPAATGKTVLLATWLQTRDEVLACFVGAGDITNTVSGALRYLLQLMQAAGYLEQAIPFDSFEIAKMFSQALQTEHHKPLIILIDGVDRLEPAPPDWIPSWLGAGNKLLISYRTAAAASLDFAPLQYPQTVAVDLACFPFDAAKKNALIDLYLGRYLKEFTPEQKAALVQLQGASSLLYLQLVLSVLCISARFEDLQFDGQPATFQQRIQAKFAFGSTPQTAFTSVIKRLEADFSSSFVLLGFGFLAASRQGLSIRELRDLLSSLIMELDGPTIENRLLDGFWQIRDAITVHEDLYHFSYDLFGEAALDYISQTLSLEWHAVLAAYFRTEWALASERQLHEYAYHCLAQGDSGALGELYTDAAYLEARCASGFDSANQRFNGVWELLLDLERLTQAAVPADLKAFAGELRGFLAARYAFLRQYPRHIVQELANYFPARRPLAAQLNTSARQLVASDHLLLEGEPPGRAANWVNSTVVRTLPAESFCLTGGEDGSLACWEIRPERWIEQQWRVNVHDSPILWLDTQANRALTTARSSIYYWDLTRLRARQVQGKHPLLADFHFAAFLDPRTLLTCYKQNRLAVIDIFSELIIWQGEIATTSAAQYLARRFDFSSAAQRFVFYDGQALRVFEWQAPQLVEIAALPTLPDPNHIAISDDGEVVLAADRRVVVELTHLESGEKQELRRHAPLLRICACGDKGFCGYQFDGVLVKFLFGQPPHESYSDELLSFIDNGIVDMTAGLNSDAVVCLQQPGAIAQFNLPSAAEEWRFSPPVLLSHGTLTATRGRAAGVPALRPNSILPDLPQDHVALDHAVRTAAAGIRHLASLDNGQIVTAAQNEVCFLQGSQPVNSCTLPGAISGLCAWQADTAIVSAGSESFAINRAGQWRVANASRLVGGTIVQIAAVGIAAADRKEPACVVAANVGGEFWVNGATARGFLGKLFASPAALAVDPAGQWAAAGGTNGRVIVWKLADREEVFNETLHQGAVTGLSFDHRGTRVYTVAEDHCLYVIDLATLAIVRATVLPWTPIAVRVYPDNAVSVLSRRGDVLSFDTGLETPVSAPSPGGLLRWFRRGKQR